jgi:hypothetical protein
MEVSGQLQTLVAPNRWKESCTHWTEGWVGDEEKISLSAGDRTPSVFKSYIFRILYAAVLKLFRSCSSRLTKYELCRYVSQNDGLKTLL